MEIENTSSKLCKACGLCCTGHLFEWTKLRSAELIPIETLGVKVYREPGRRGFDQPCPFWDELCTIYSTRSYPGFCRSYKCNLLKKMDNDEIELHDAIESVQTIKELITEIDSQINNSDGLNFRDRILKMFEKGISDREMYAKLLELLKKFKETFGVNFEIDQAELNE